MIEFQAVDYLSIKHKKPVGRCSHLFTENNNKPFSTCCIFRVKKCASTIAQSAITRTIIRCINRAINRAVTRLENLDKRQRWHR